MDAEKLSQTYSYTKDEPQLPAIREPGSLKYVRAVQLVISTIGLVFICCAVDRNILVPGVTAEEQALIASVSGSFDIL